MTAKKGRETTELLNLLDPKALKKDFEELGVLWQSVFHRASASNGESLVSDSNRMPLLKDLKRLVDLAGHLAGVLLNENTARTPDFYKELDEGLGEIFEKYNLAKLPAFFELWLKAQRKIRATFAIPSHPLMFTLLCMFAGKPERIPRKLLEKPYKERTLDEQKQAEDFLHSIFETKSSSFYTPEGNVVREEKTTAVISNNPKIEAKAEITGTLFSEDLSFREGALAIYIKRSFKAEGLRHLLGLLIGLEDNFRQGYFEWNVNEHLERLGYKKRHRAYDTELKRTATEIVKIFTSLFITARRKDKGGKEIILGERLFNIDGFKIEMFEQEIINESIKLRATDFWYKHAFEPPDGSNPKFTKLLRKIAQENHRNHPLTIYLTPLLAIFWRMSPTGHKLSIKALLDWCNLRTKTGKGYGRREIRNLEAELNYMREAGYLGDWENSGEAPLPSQCKVPLKCVLTLTPPGWLQKELLQIKGETIKHLPPPKEEPLLTREELTRLIHNSGLTIKQFANHVGVSRQMISYIKNGQRKMTRRISDKIREVFGDMLPV